MIVGVLTVELQAPAAQSLKDKRQVVQVVGGPPAKRV